MKILGKGRKLALMLSVCAAVTFLSAACGNKEVENEAEILAGVSGEEEIFGWQGQYDLGIRLLGEGKYEEAIIAFAAAIEIEPKRAAAYIALADAYVEAGEPEEAERILADAPEDVDEPEALRRRQEEIQALLQAKSEGPETEELEPELNEYGAVVFQQREEYEPYEEMTPERQAMVDRLADIAISGEVQSLAAEMAWAAEKDYTNLYTEKEGYRIRIWSTVRTEDPIAADCYDILIYVEVREENGSGFVVILSQSEYDGTIQEESFQTKGSCKNWQWEGAVKTVYTTWYEISEYGIRSNSSRVETGTMKDGLREGDFVRTGSYEFKSEYHNDSHEINETKVFHRGVCQLEFQQADGSVRVEDALMDAAGMTIGHTLEDGDPYGALQKLFW